MAFKFGNWFGGRSSGVATVRLMRDSNPYHAVSVHPQKDCCQGAVQLAAKRFLSAKAPSLPLPGCDAAHCDCRYTHFSDRRSGFDRRRTLETADVASRPFERRIRRGRRSVDAVV
jgi:hypothetical protein